ncbi:hypothetical protein [Wolbachia endosymbiont of Folsomia candida]|nr:hypothetical protein ASM33_03130 [Wolbachia endosymbiont of Folsomia candida]
MRNVKLSFLLIFFLIFGLSYQGYADCPPFVESNTGAESGGKKVLDGFLAIITFGTKGGFAVDEKLYQYIHVKAIKAQGVDGYFNPKIEVCNYEKNNCHQLYSGVSCHKIYGTQGSGAGVSAMTFIDWEGNKTSIGAQMGEGLEWEWADGVTDEEKKKFANSPKICACSQKGSCMSGVSVTFSRLFEGANIFSLDGMEKVCDTCTWGSRGKQKVKCAPVPLAPGPPPFCEQLGMSPPQVRVVPITNNDNDYFNPKVKVLIGDLKDENGKIGKRLDFPKEYKKDKPETKDKLATKEFSISDEKSTTYYFKTYKEKDKLCTEYYGTERIDEKNLQFSRCFPAPPVPEPEIVEIVKDPFGNPSNTLKIKIKMSKETCTRQARGDYSGDSCTFNVNNSVKYIGHLSLKVVKPTIVEKTDDSSDDKSGHKEIDKILKKILNQNKDKDFKILQKYGYVPDIQVGCAGSIDDKDFSDLKDFNEEKIKECKLDSLGQPEIEVKYKDDPKSKMLCFSGWKAEPEEFVLEREDKVISLRKIGTSYARYNTVYSKESNQSYYFPCTKTDDLLTKPQSQLDEMIFNKRGYVSIPEENKKRDNCIVTETKKIDETQDCTKCKIAYKLVDAEHKKGCKQGDDEDNYGCMCFNNVCERSTQYIKNDNTPFYLRVSQKTDGTVEKLEVPTKANRAEVFYADKLCRFDLEGLKERLRDIIKRQLESKRLQLLDESKTPSEDPGQNSYTGNLSKYDYVEIEAWGGGEAGHISGKATSTEDRQGMPGDYVKAKLKIDPSYPIIRVKVTEGGGGQESYKSNKDGGPTIIEMCNSSGSDCKTLVTVAGGGNYRTYGGEKYDKTEIHREDLKLEAKIVRAENLKSTEDNKIPYIKDGKIDYEPVRECNNSRRIIPGAGGCINKSGKKYSKGAPGYAIIRPILNAIANEKIDVINSAIDEIIDNPNILISDNSSTIGLSDDSLVNQLINDSLIKKFDSKIMDTIKKEIEKELLGQDTSKDN